MKSIIVAGALPESLLNFRGQLIKSLTEDGWAVTAIAGEANKKIVDGLRNIGAYFIPYSIRRSGLNPFVDIVTYCQLKNIINKVNPDIYFGYTIKPIIWGGLASRNNPNVKFIALITGLGFAFQGKTIKRKVLCKIVEFLYRISLSFAHKVVFQNIDNLNYFVEKELVDKNKAEIINGTGVDLKHYQYANLRSGKVIFLLIARLLYEKGIREYISAAQKVKIRYPDVEFQLLGPSDPSPDGISLNAVKQWHDSKYITYLGESDDVRPFLQACHVYVLPSYHEGMPRTVLEAMSTGRPILTTDVPGCRETVIPGENGFLVPKADIYALVNRMIWFIENRDQLKIMGEKSRELAIIKYDVHKINRQLIMLCNKNK